MHVCVKVFSDNFSFASHYINGPFPEAANLLIYIFSVKYKFGIICEITFSVKCQICLKVQISCSAEHADYRQTQKARWNKSSIYQLVLYLTDDGERGTEYNNVYVW